jgi:hypothetical protein
MQLSLYRDSVRAGPSGNQIPVRAISSLPSRLAPEHTPSCTKYRVVLWTKGPERSADQSLPSDVGLRMGWYYTSACPLCLNVHVIGRLYLYLVTPTSHDEILIHLPRTETLERHLKNVGLHNAQ